MSNDNYSLVIIEKPWNGYYKVSKCIGLIVLRLSLANKFNFKSYILGTIRHQQGQQLGCPGGEWHRHPEKSSENLPNQQSVSIN